MTLTPNGPEDRNRGGQLRGWEHQPDTHGLVEDISDALVCRNNDEFLVTNLDGEMESKAGSGLGYYVRDSRHLSGYSLRINGETPLVLASAAQSGFSQEQVLGNRRGLYEGQVVGRATIELVRTRYLSVGLTEHLEITNHNKFPVSIRLAYSFDADFKDIFEVRGHIRLHPGRSETPVIGTNHLSYCYIGADGVRRQTTIRFETRPTSITSRDVEYELNLGGHQTLSLNLYILAGETTDLQPASFESMRADYSAWRRSFAQIHTDNEYFNDIVSRSLDDLRTLWTSTGEHGYFAAGVPWFATLFGRDTIITAIEVLSLRPDLARQCLHVLAETQSQSLDPTRVQEPGKILHETRMSELNSINELPYETYYGSVDSTPLFLILVAEYYNWTGDIETLSQLKPNILAALAWIRTAVACHGHSPYLCYDTDAYTGLRNQGWKDSDDAIVHEDGSLLSGSVALAEVQAYVFAAYSRLQSLLFRLGEEELANHLVVEARRLQAAFSRDFWDSTRDRVALARDGEGRSSFVSSSNAGQALWGGILDETQAQSVRAALFEPDMFSGWGIRTLSSSSQSYFPLGYHLGSVWPHDNALIAAGLKRYGFDSEVTEVFTGLFDAAQQFPSPRLPELFGGQNRSTYLPPVPYPVACRPQAWAAGSMLYLLRSALGLSADAANGKFLVARPQLPFWLSNVVIRELRVGSGKVDLRFERGLEGTRAVIERAVGVRVEVE